MPGEDQGKPPGRKSWQPPTGKPGAHEPGRTPLPPRQPPTAQPRRESAPPRKSETIPAGKPRQAARPLAGPPASAARAASRQRGAFGHTPRTANQTANRTAYREPGTVFISRGERVIFWVLLATVLAMAIYLVRYRERVNAHFEERAQVPLSDAATTAAPSPVTLLVADDDSGALTPETVAFPLPADAGTRARVILEKLLNLYTLPSSGHPLKATPPGVGSVDEVFLSPVPGSSGQLATVDLTPEFVRLHPSGIEPETLTLLSMIATLHSALPSVTQVHFLVDGEPRPTLAGHADLTQTYLAGTVQMAQPMQFAGAR